MSVSRQKNNVKIITLNPGHFHAALVHKYSYDEVDPVVHVYAPEGDELSSHLSLLEQFNSREESPANWDPRVYRGEDYLERMVKDKPGNVMVVAGNNARKIEYIYNAVKSGINVLSDKPMIINPGDFGRLKEALETADEDGLLVNDIMTERYEITTILQRKLSRIPELFGELVKGSPDDPAISKVSVHHFYKLVSGKPLVRPAWYFDVAQQGEGIVDVTTHLVDLVLWQSFPGESLDYENPDDDINVLSAKRWDTEFTRDMFEKVTGLDHYPDFLTPHVKKGSVLAVSANGEFTFKVRGIHAKVSVIWDYENPDGGDTHFSRMRGTLADLVIRQGDEEDFEATLYVEPAENSDKSKIESVLEESLEHFKDQYPGLSKEPAGDGWRIGIPDQFREGHEEHFTRVTQQYLEDLQQGKLPVWERTNLLTKYYITAQAYELSVG